MFESYKLSDTVIGQIAKILQLDILTVTDITDNLLLMRLVVQDDVLVLEPQYENTFDENLNKMLSEVQKNTEVSDESDKQG